MTFLHKLARRLARLKDLTPIAVAAVSLAAAIMGCEQAGTSTQPITPTVSQLIVSPKAVTLQPDQLQDFMAVGLLSTGDTAQVDVTWSTSGGSVAATSTHGGRHYGQYKSGSCGTYQVTATAHPGNKFDVASVSVACPATVASVVVSPPVASVPKGQSQQLTATPDDARGLGRQSPLWLGDDVGEQQSCDRDGGYQRAHHRCGARVGLDHSGERGAERDLDHHGDDGRGSARGVGDGEPGDTKCHGGPDGAAVGDYEGREQQYADGPDRDVAE